MYRSPGLSKLIFFNQVKLAGMKRDQGDRKQRRSKSLKEMEECKKISRKIARKLRRSSEELTEWKEDIRWWREKERDEEEED